MLHGFLSRRIVNSFKSGELVSAKRLNSNNAPLATLALQHDFYAPSDGNSTNRPLLILHGFLGSKRNWTSLGKAFARDLGRPVYTLDLRNHGSSPHSESMTYCHTADDVLAFCAQHRLSDISLLGHSMGGKVAMTFALSPSLPPSLLRHLIVTDISPAKGSVGDKFKEYVMAMRRIEEKKVMTRKEANAILEKTEPDSSIRAFLLTNVASEQDGPIRFKVPLDILFNGIDMLGDFPYEVGEVQWNGRVLFVKGARSKYLNPRTIAIAKQYFPGMELAELDAGHWVHSERPNEFRKLVNDFVRRFD